MDNATLQFVQQIVGQASALTVAILWIIDLRRQRDELRDTILDEFKRYRDNRFMPPQTNP